MKTKIEVDKTMRGFAVGEFTDYYGQSCSIQKSSLADRDCIWLGIDDANPLQGPPWEKYPLPDDVLVHTRMHLTRGQVRSLLPLLRKFVDTWELS